jgi:two-component system, OmpR family, response regulator ResD
MATETILVVDDEPEIQEFVSKYLRNSGYTVRVAGDGLQAKSESLKNVDLVILDLGLPELDGLEVTRYIRQNGTTPILILTARGEESDRVLGLELGADDYLTKPFSPRELVARVKALLRRSTMSRGSSTQGLQIDSESRRVTLAGELVELTPTEYELLRVLSQSPQKTFTREELLDRVWGPEYVADSRRVDMHVSKLREKLTRPEQPTPIRSVWGVGYRFE